METYKIILIVLAIIVVGIFVVAHFCFNDKDPDMDWYNNYTEAERPHIPYKTCLHKGGKTIKSIGNVVNCETVQLVCDDCGETLKQETDCR